MQQSLWSLDVIDQSIYRYGGQLSSSDLTTSAAPRTAAMTSLHWMLLVAAAASAHRLGMRAVGRMMP